MGDKLHDFNVWIVCAPLDLVKAICPRGFLRGCLSMFVALPIGCVLMLLTSPLLFLAFLVSAFEDFSNVL